MSLQRRRVGRTARVGPHRTASCTCPVSRWMQGHAGSLVDVHGAVPCRFNSAPFALSHARPHRLDAVPCWFNAVLFALSHARPHLRGASARWRSRRESSTPCRSPSPRTPAIKWGPALSQSCHESLLVAVDFTAFFRFIGKESSQLCWVYCACDVPATPHGGEERPAVVPASRSIPPNGGQFEFVWLPARLPHGARVWRAQRNQGKYPPG